MANKKAIQLNSSHELEAIERFGKLIDPRNIKRAFYFWSLQHFTDANNTPLLYKNIEIYLKEHNKPFKEYDNSYRCKCEKCNK